jgi:hypothetical protein
MKKGKVNKSTRESYEKWILTNEDWYPSFEPNKYGNPHNHYALHVTCAETLSHKNDWYVSVWGADDFGMESFSLSRIEALEIFKKINDFSGRLDFAKLGLVNA